MEAGRNGRPGVQRPVRGVCVCWTLGAGGVGRHNLAPRQTMTKRGRREIPAAPARHGRVFQPVPLLPFLLPSRSPSPLREQGAALRYLMRGWDAVNGEGGRVGGGRQRTKAAGDKRQATSDQTRDAGMGGRWRRCATSTDRARDQSGHGDGGGGLVGGLARSGNPDAGRLLTINRQLKCWPCGFGAGIPRVSPSACHRHAAYQVCARRPARVHAVPRGCGLCNRTIAAVLAPSWTDRVGGGRGH